MSELVVEVCEISDVKNHPGADRLDVCQVKGWQVVIKRGEFKTNDHVVYFPPDTVLPKTWTDLWGVSNYCQEKPEGMRIRQARLRGEPSFGLVIPVPDPTWEVGKSVVDFYGATKYEPPILGQAGDVAGKEHPLFNRYTDIENLQNFPDVFQEGEEVVATEKVHGCLHRDTRIMLVNGEEIPIANVVPGNVVLSYDEEQKTFVGRKIVKLLVQEKTKALEWYKLEFDNGRALICTEDHPILTSDGWKTAKNLSEKDEIVSFY